MDSHGGWLARPAAIVAFVSSVDGFSGDVHMKAIRDPIEARPPMTRVSSAVQQNWL